MLAPPARRRPQLLSIAEVAAPTMHLSSTTSSSNSPPESHEDSLSPLQYLPLLQPRPARSFSLMKVAMDMVRSLFPSIQAFIFPTCQLPLLSVVPPRVSLSPISSGRRRVVAGTFFGHKKGRISFAVQSDPRSEPVLLLELAMLTCDLVKEMASGMVRILLECDRVASPASAAAATDKSSKKSTSNSNSKRHSPLWDEPLWTVSCNGHRYGYAVSRRCTGFDLHVLSMVRAVSVGAGVLPPPPLLPAQPPETEKGSYKRDGVLSYGSTGGAGGAGAEVMYMRAKFERVVGSKDSEAFYLINPDSVMRKGSDVSGGPELCIFLLRM